MTDLKAIEIPLYRGYLLIVISDDPEEVAEVLGIDRDAFKDGVFCHSVKEIGHKGKQAWAVVLNFKNKFNKISYGIVTHEATHTANAIAEARGFVADFNNDEPIAYLAEWIVDEIVQFCMIEKGYNFVVGKQ